ncbi:probable WRKY transcription factor 19 isoform X2 [Helianthus annuus]|uniref:probable WRKY transcription factor 19 isoform X2 n=1 Tax=Helianthus annuus TaxID=4232 RepID=UPI000B8F1D97|nr:probable WRKY transcription factor 19 isoform X2 [Helianthus annuus]
MLLLETSILKEIVDTIYNKLDRKRVHLPSNITGVATRYEDISSWLEECNLEFLSICGMAGSGKTTLAKYIYDSNWKSFEYASFVENIGSRCDLHELQEQLLKDILGGEKRKVPCVSRGTCMIEEALEMNKALIVLDDIVEHKQLVALIGTGKINAQTKIIITTRENTDTWFDLSCWRSQKYEMKLLNGDESSELLCHHAFRSKIPTTGFQEVVSRVVQYCEGNPLALEVVGSSLYKNDSTSYWESLLKSFERDVDSRIQDVLIRSYEELPSDTVKGLFLHIACFFVGIDKDYVVKILEPDYSAISGITVLINKCLLSVSPNKVLMMHRLVQEMGKNIVRKESKYFPAKCSRVWLSIDSYKILSKGKGSKTVEGLALDMKLLREDKLALKASYLETGAFKKMVNLKLLQLNFVELKGSYKHVSEDLRWLCWHGFHLEILPADLCVENLVAIDMSSSNLEVFEPPTDIQSLKILNLKDSYKLREIRNMIRMPNLETLILWNCYSLVNICESLGALSSLTLLHMSGCKNLFSWEHTEPTFSFPVSLHRLFLKDCHLQCSDSFPLSFIFQPDLQYLNLGNSRFESLSCYDHLKSLRVLDLSFCSRLKYLICLPGTLSELYIYYCESLEKITFQSHRFPLQELGYEGCVNLYEIEDYVKLVPIAKLDETDLGHMEWLKEYQNHEVCLVGDDELTVGRSWHIQMLYEFNIMSTSLPNVNDPRMTPEYMSESSSLSFDVPSCPKNKRLKGINVTFKYSVSSVDWAWFCKVSTTNGVVDLIYNPKVFGKPECGEVGIWLSYWPIGNTLDFGNTVHVSIVVMSGLEVHECGVSLVYSDKETMENNMGGVEIFGGDLSGFELSTGAYYLCRRDFFSLMEVGRLTRDWFRILVGDTIDYTEVRGWRKTGRPKQVNDPSFTELKTVRCIIYGPQVDDTYKIAEMSKSSLGDDTVAFTSSLLKEETIDEIEAVEEINVKQYKSRDETSDRYSHARIMKPATGEGEIVSSSTSAYPCRRFSLAKIQSATNNFSDELVIGWGGFGKVYKGQIFSEEAGHIVAIKRRDSMSYFGEPEFKAEIDTLCTFHHVHLVSLVGYCDDNEEKILVYKYMPKGSLYDQLHNVHTPLSWVTRLKIAIGAARGLEYLHIGVRTQHGVIHRNVKSSNILLDENWVAVISGLGLCIAGPTDQSIPYVEDTVKGTFGYLDPEYFFTRKLTYKADVYAFGVVLFELLSGRLPIDDDKEEDERSLVRWAQKSFKERKLNHMVDSNIKGTISSKCFRQFAQIADRCVHRVPEERPTMSELVASLEALLELQEKSDSSAKSSSIMGFPWKIKKYFVPATKPNPEESGTSSQKSHDKNKKRDDE